MEEIAQKAAKTVDRTEKELLTSVALKEPTYSGLEYQLSNFREACSNFIFLDFQAAVKKNIEARLWGAHGKVNQKFRPLLAKFREGDGKKKTAERRKAEKLYLDFIKSGMRFYRGFIQRLASHFQDVPQVFEIARKFSLDTLAVDAPVPVDLEQKRMILRSCHATLIQLGDLSRYRETELNQKQRNWGPAKGYYDLATAIDPTSGQSFNQLAVIALADNEHLRAVYYLYRALTVRYPPEPVRRNLDLEFKKLRTQHERKTASTLANELSSTDDLETRFITFHAYAYCGAVLAYNDEYRSDVLRQLADDLRERPFDTTIRKICLINIASEYCAKERAKALIDEPEEALSQVELYQKMQSLNIATFCMLLRLLLNELQPIIDDSDGRMTGRSNHVSHVTPVIRRILPHLRLYSAWLLSNVEVMLISQSATSIGIDLQNLWRVYTEALNLLLATFPLRTLPDIPYLLDEDEDTLAFVPFTETPRRLHHRTFDGKIKPSYNNLGESKERVPEDEMLFRVKELVRDGIYLHKHRDEFGLFPVPVMFGEGRFVFVDDQSPPPAEVSAPQHGHTSSINSVSREDIDAARLSQINGHTVKIQANPEIMSDTGVSGSAPSAMEHMVNDLVLSETSDAVMFDGPTTPTVTTPTYPMPATYPVSHSQPGTWTAQDLVRQMHQQTSGSTHPLGAPQTHNRPSLPSIWNTAFTPRPGETPGSSPRPGTARQIESASYATAPTSSALFAQEMLQRQHALQNRSSPLLAWEPSSLSSYETPSGIDKMYNAQDYGQPSSPSWRGSSNETAEAGASTTRRQSPGAMFGAIGEPRRFSAKTPTSGQGG